MKAVRLRIYLWFLILLKFMDVMLTTYAHNNLPIREVNPLGYNIVIIVSIIYLFIMFAFMKYYDRFKEMRVEMIQHYRIYMNLLLIAILIYCFVVINNCYMILTH